MNRRQFQAAMAGTLLPIVLPGCATNAQRTSSTHPANVDTHAHVFRRGLALARGRRYAPDDDATLADYLGMLDRNGIARGVLVQPSFLGTDNGCLLAALAQAPARLLGIRAVLAQTFERIHRSNLIGMGILPLRVPPECAPERLRIAPGDRIEVDAPAAALEPRAKVTVSMHRADGAIETYQATAAVETRLEVDLLRQGGVIPYILQKTIAGQGQS
jgi:hypothetical protein